MANFYTVSKTINGKEYTAQFNGVEYAFEAVDSNYIEGSNNISTKGLSKFILKNVIVEPAGLTPNDFDTVEECNEVVSFGREVMQGHFREKANKKSASKES